MKYDDFEGAMNHYQRRVGDDAVYGRFLVEIERCWANTGADTAEMLVEFLNKWGRMRINVTMGLRQQLASALRQGRLHIDEFRRLRIEDENAGLISIGDERLRVRTAIVFLFELFGSVGTGFADVATTKALHILAPGYFVIWDNTTRDRVATRYRSFAWTYAEGFLPKVKHDFEELLSDVSAKFAVSRRDAINRIANFGGITRTVAKRMDEYYFAVHKYGYKRPVH